MVWQDIVLSLAECALLVSIIPQIVLGFKKKKGYITYATSINSTLCLLAVGVSMFTLSLYVTSLVAFLNAFAWSLFIVQRMRWGGP